MYENRSPAAGRPAGRAEGGLDRREGGAERLASDLASGAPEPVLDTPEPFLGRHLNHAPCALPGRSRKQTKEGPAREPPHRCRLKAGLQSPGEVVRPGVRNEPQGTSQRAPGIHSTGAGCWDLQPPWATETRCRLGLGYDGRRLATLADVGDYYLEGLALRRVPQRVDVCPPGPLAPAK